MRISVYGSTQLQAVILRMRQADRNVKRVIRAETRRVAQPEWQKAIAENASTRFENRVLAQTARVQVSDQNVQLRSAHIGKKLSGGLLPSMNYHAAEFGADRNQTKTYEARSKKGRTFTVTRHTTKQLRPRNRKGYVVFPAAASIIPRLASLWVQTAVRELYDSFEAR